MYHKAAYPNMDEWEVGYPLPVKHFHKDEFGFGGGGGGGGGYYNQALSPGGIPESFAERQNSTASMIKPLL